MQRPRVEISDTAAAAMEVLVRARAEAGIAQMISAASCSTARTIHAVCG